MSPVVPVASYDGGGKSWLATEVRRRSLARGRREPRSTREKKRMKSKRRHEHRQLRRRWPRRRRLRSCRRASQGLRLCWWCREEEAAGRASTLVRVFVFLENKWKWPGFSFSSYTPTVVNPRSMSHVSFGPVLRCVHSHH